MSQKLFLLLNNQKNSLWLIFGKSDEKFRYIEYLKANFKIHHKSQTNISPFFPLSQILSSWQSVQPYPRHPRHLPSPLYLVPRSFMDTSSLSQLIAVFPFLNSLSKELARTFPSLRACIWSSFNAWFIITCLCKRKAFPVSLPSQLSTN